MFLNKLIKPPFRLTLTVNSPFSIICVQTPFFGYLSDNCASKNMSKKPNLLKPPDHVSGLTVLDKNLFEKTISVPCLRVKDVKISSVLPFVRKYLLKMENFKPVLNLSEQEVLFHLDPEKVTQWTDLDFRDRDALNSLNLGENCFEHKSHVLKYENFSADTILRAVVPKDLEGTSSYTKVGHIVHVNLREHLFPFKNLIGEILLEKVHGCRTVVNKIDNIDNTYRNFKMEVLRGEDDMLTRVKENKCIFEFDFSKVYWNSRLCTEHERIVKIVKDGDVFFDVFAGVGPFSIPIAKKKGLVFANDLNPESFKWLEHNSRLNKVDEKFFNSYNKDGKQFILEDIKEKLPLFLKEKRKIYICMNLPALALEFLPHLLSLYDEEYFTEEIEVAPIAIVYCFTKGENCVDLAKSSLFKTVGCDVSDKIVEIFKVRTVSNFKEMMRITLKLDRDMLIGTIFKNKRKLESEDTDLNAVKKCNLFSITG